ncbi:hypothetical protein XMD420_001822 [Marinobacterium sp. xm-d-420]|uniref:hypothetical protein n=1 Tax=Marinobacterium sp. xm-d-420 TaxID=2497737 RepID=UPI00156A65CA|nr:hypothetical protein [Marinobacterium sp. xm-d-420]NRP28216.1 hypothetical protein [Marinobacterium sp. xm-d-420]
MALILGLFAAYFSVKVETWRQTCLMLELVDPLDLPLLWKRNRNIVKPLSLAFQLTGKLFFSFSVASWFFDNGFSEIFSIIAFAICYFAVGKFALISFGKALSQRFPTRQDLNEYLNKIR